MKQKAKCRYGILTILLVLSICFQSITSLADEEGYIPDGAPMARNLIGKPTGISIHTKEKNSLCLEWTGAEGASTYIVYRSDDAGATWNQIGATNTTNYADTAVQWDKSYLYQVQSAVYHASTGEWQGGGFSEVVSGQLSIAVPAITKLSVDEKTVELQWDFEGEADLYGIMRSETEDGVYEWLTAVSVKKYTDVVPDVDKTYYYKVYAAVSDGANWRNGEASVSKSVYVPDCYKMDAPKELSAVNQEDKGILLTWEGNKNATAYVVYQLNADGEWEWVNVTGAYNLLDTAVKIGEEKTYCVQSKRFENGLWMDGPYSDPITITMLPSVPTALSVGPGAGNQALKLSWKATGKAGLFGIMRSETIDGVYEWIGASAETCFTDMGREVGKTYYYRVYAAVNDNGVWYNGSESSVAGGKVQVAPTDVSVFPESVSSVRVKWTAAPGADGYMVWRRSNDGSSWSPIGAVTQNEYIDKGLDVDRTYCYQVQSMNYVDGSWGYGAYSELSEGQPDVGMVQNLEAFQDKSVYYGIALEWQPMPDVDVYGILRAEHGTDNYQWIGGTQTAAYVDASGEPSKQYDYKVYAAANVNGTWHNGANSSAVTEVVRERNGAPVISDVRVQYVDGTGYLVTCIVASPNAVSQVVFPTWTTAGGQDDLVWKNGTVNGSQVSCWIYTGEHNYEVGQYETCIYAYDSNGKNTGTWCCANVPVFNHGTGTGWYDTNGSSGYRFYLVNGQAVTGWKYIGGLKYYFYPNGVLCQNVDSIIGPQSSYVLKLNKQMNCLTIYASDGANGYVIPVKSMLTSTGDDTPLGTFYTPEKYRWRKMVTGAYAQYATRLTAGQGFLFHSITYEAKNSYTLQTIGYNRLGINKSLGCIRLVCGDAYWIYVRCPLGTKVIVYNDGSTPGPFYRPILTPIPDDQRWDPTDPNL